MPNVCSSGRNPGVLAVQNVQHFFLTLFFLFFFLKEGKTNWTAPPFSILIRLMRHAECRDPNVGVLWETGKGVGGWRGRHLSLKTSKIVSLCSSRLKSHWFLFSNAPKVNLFQRTLQLCIFRLDAFFLFLCSVVKSRVMWSMHIIFEKNK